MRITTPRELPGTTSALSAQLEIPKRSSGYQADKKVLPRCRGSSEGAAARGEAPSHQSCRAAPIDPRGDEGGTWPAAPHDLAMTCLLERSADSIAKRNKTGLAPSATSRPSITTPSQFTTTPSRIRMHCPKQLCLRISDGTEGSPAPSREQRGRGGQRRGAQSPMLTGGAHQTTWR